MARPRVFVSSTYYDLKHLRSSLEGFIESLGFDPILSEKGDIAYMPDEPMDESCYREVRNADVYVLIIGGRYGSERSGPKSPEAKAFFERYDSITKEEYKSAAAKDIPIYILIERSVYSDYENFLRNKDNNTFRYAHVDSVNIFILVEEILARPRNNSIYQFDRYADIVAWLREQWAGMFKELLSRMANQRQLESLSAQVAQLAEYNQTLKRYMEEVMTKVAPKEAAQLIASESKRLFEASKLARLSQIKLIRWLISIIPGPVSIDDLARLVRDSDDLNDFVHKLQHTDPSSNIDLHISFLTTTPGVDDDFNLARAVLGLPPAPASQPDN